MAHAPATSPSLCGKRSSCARCLQATNMELLMGHTQEHIDKAGSCLLTHARGRGGASCHAVMSMLLELERP